MSKRMDLMVKFRDAKNELVKAGAKGIDVSLNEKELELAINAILYLENEIANGCC